MKHSDHSATELYHVITDKGWGIAIYGWLFWLGFVVKIFSTFGLVWTTGTIKRHNVKHSHLKSEHDKICLCLQSVRL